MKKTNRFFNKFNVHVREDGTVSYNPICTLTFAHDYMHNTENVENNDGYEEFIEWCRSFLLTYMTYGPDFTFTAYVTGIDNWRKDMGYEVHPHYLKHLILAQHLDRPEVLGKFMDDYREKARQIMNERDRKDKEAAEKDRQRERELRASGHKLLNLELFQSKASDYRVHWEAK